VSHGILIKVTHTGQAGISIFLSDIHDAVSDLDSFRKPGPIYVPINQSVCIVYTKNVAISFETGAIRQFVGTGDVTFNSALGATDKVRASYYYAGSFSFTVAPTTGKRLKLNYVEIQFTDDVDPTGDVIFQILVYNPDPPPTKVVYKELRYKDLFNYFTESTGPFPVQPLIGTRVVEEVTGVTNIQDPRWLLRHGGPLRHGLECPDGRRGPDLGASVPAEDHHAPLPVPRIPRFAGLAGSRDQGLPGERRVLRDEGHLHLLLSDRGRGVKALVLSGGGSRGSWQAGVLKYMAEAQCGGFKFVSGTSVGSINACGVAMFLPENFPDATEYIDTLWRTKVTKTSDVWKLRCPLGIPGLWNPSIGTNDQLRKLLNDVVDIEAIVQSGIMLRLPAADLETGDLRTYTVGDLAQYGIEPVMASASFPLAFPPVEVGGHWMTDGGLIDIAPLGAAIDAGAEEVMVLVTRNPKQLPFKSRKDMKNVLQVGLRDLDIMEQTVLESDLKVCEVYNKILASGVELEGKKAVKVTVLYPLEPLGDSLDFSGELMKQQMDQGYSDAKELLTPST